MFPTASSPDHASYDSDTSDERPSSQPARTKIHATFQIARPPPKSYQRLLRTPKLLLQIQQLAPNHHPVPVLEIYEAHFRKSKLTRDFAQRPPKLAKGDLYAALGEPYITAHTRNQSASSETAGNGDDQAQEKDIIAVMCDATSTAYFRDARCSWQASTGTTGAEQSAPCYRFAISDENGKELEHSTWIMQWEKKSSSHGIASTDKDQFVLFIIDRKTRRRSRVATMDRGGVEVKIRKGALLAHLQKSMDLTSPVPGPSQNHPYGILETWLYTHILTLGVWVASQEGWLS
ncbi:hypothetical protein N7510_007405 [Penicillium lagena]|uniref:uncharacterized protein n=1 Tax=Penicillium lagena TaxID=94218 RepID=UPI002540B979|nr:uncharacterized protein N7510_007405 [Penicillium lagena]KAJ5610686.1 hypothetical protein N7510_007405 [Penicillium lagena]